MIKIIKVKERNGGLDIIIKFNKEKLYSLLKALYNVSRGSKKLVKKFITESILNYAKENK